MKKLLFLTSFTFLILQLVSCDRSVVTPEREPDAYVQDIRGHSGFKEIRAGKSVKLKIKVGEDFSVVVDSPESGLNDLKTEVEGETLIVSSRPGQKQEGKPITVLVSLPELTRLDVWGSSSAVVSNAKTESLILQAGGDSVIEIDGEAKEVKIVATGVGRIDAEKLRSENCVVKAAGASEVTVWTVNELNAEVQGASNVFFPTEPKKLVQSIIGAGKISKK